MDGDGAMEVPPEVLELAVEIRERIAEIDKLRKIIDETFKSERRLRAKIDMAASDDNEAKRKLEAMVEEYVSLKASYNIRRLDDCRAAESATSRLLMMAERELEDLVQERANMVDMASRAEWLLKRAHDKLEKLFVAWP